MSAVDWAGLAVSITILLSAQAALSKFLTKHYLHELRPNGGNSIKDEVREIKSEQKAMKEQVLFLTDLVKEAIKK